MNYMRVRKSNDNVIFVGAGIMTFFTTDSKRFGYIKPSKVFKSGIRDEGLMSVLPILHKGYLTVRYITRLFELYILINMKNEIIFKSDDIMDYAFGGDIPAVFYLYRDENGTLYKMPMTYALEQRLISHPLNTYEVIKNVVYGFNKNKFNRTYITYIISANSYYLNDLIEPYPGAYDSTTFNTLEQIISHLEKHDIRTALEDEYDRCIRALHQTYNIITDHYKQIYDANLLASQGNLEKLIELAYNGIFPNQNGLFQAVKNGHSDVVDWINLNTS